MREANHDFLEEIIEERSERTPEFRELVDTALRQRELIRTLAEARESQRLSQTAVAARMHTSQSAVARLEAGADSRLSTVARYAAALGKRVEWQVEDDDKIVPA